MLVSAAWQTSSMRRMGLVRAAADAALVRKLRLVALVALLHLLSLVDIICTLPFSLGERSAQERSVVDAHVCERRDGCRYLCADCRYL